MNFLLYVVLFVIFSPKFFMVLGGRRIASVTMTDILFHALLFALGLYAVGYLTRTYHIFEGYSNNAEQKKMLTHLKNVIRKYIDKNKNKNKTITDNDIITHIRTNKEINKQKKSKFGTLTDAQIIEEIRNNFKLTA